MQMDMMFFLYKIVLKGNLTSSMPSQWFGLVNLSSFSGPHALAPEPQLMMFRMIMPENGMRIRDDFGLF